MHWVSVEHAIDAEIRLYDRLFVKENPVEDEDFIADMNQNSLEILSSCKLEPSLAEAKPGEYYQFMRQGYCVVDSKDSKREKIVFNRTVGLRDSWAKTQNKSMKKH